MNFARTAALTATLWLVGAGAALAGDLRFEDFWIAETPPGAMATAGFAVIANAGDAPVAITGAESSACKRIEFHRTETTDGVAKMVRQGQLPVPAAGELVLAPGGAHLMLIGPEALHAGERVAVTFQLEGGEKVTHEAEVRARGGAKQDDAHEHHQH
jgi:hypothetical protein